MQSITTSLIAFTAAAALLTVTPGLDTALVLRTAASEGPRRAALAGLGIVVGCFAWATIVAAGLGVLLEASRVCYAILRWTGAAYLLWVGYRLLRHPRSASFVPGAAQETAGHSAFTRGALTNLLNPKMALFVLALFPQFVTPDAGSIAVQIMLLATLLNLIGLAVNGIVILTASRLGRAFSGRNRWRRAPQFVLGTVFVALAALLFTFGPGARIG